MKKADIHVLNWEKITQNTSEQSNNKTVNKGILFEDLIEKLLTAMFPKEIWRRTIESHDGKRDFVYPYEENLPDQKNVALGGFCVLREGEQLPAGNYTIAVLVVNRVSKLKLWNTTGKYLTVELPAAKE